jgi:hypothetical protein
MNSILQYIISFFKNIFSTPNDDKDVDLRPVVEYSKEGFDPEGCTIEHFSTFQKGIVEDLSKVPNPELLGKHIFVQEVEIDSDYVEPTGFGGFDLEILSKEFCGFFEDGLGFIVVFFILSFIQNLLVYWFFYLFFLHYIKYTFKSTIKVFFRVLKRKILFLTMFLAFFLGKIYLVRTFSLISTYYEIWSAAFFLVVAILWADFTLGSSIQDTCKFFLKKEWKNVAFFRDDLLNFFSFIFVVYGILTFFFYIFDFLEVV